MNKSKETFLIVVVVLFIGMISYAQKQNLKPNYVPGVIIVKLKPENRNLFVSSETNQKWVNIRNKFSVRPTFKNSQHLSNKELSNTQKVDLNLIYTLTSNSSIDGLKLLEELDFFEYVEYKRIRNIGFTPNDTELSQQYYLAQINAYAAWDINTGNVAIKIGIIDTGTDMDHPDLASEMSENLNDPINGMDDDGDGYIDNFNGWDFVDNDNIPETDESSHGIHVAGIAAAATNNNEGVASVGYNTQFMPIRVGNGVEVIYGYEGIVYAADMGCDIINCSWGGFGYSKFEEDIINYATYNKDALVVAAAGNAGLNQNYYPAAYENCLAVSSINYLDNKSSFTNYGYWVDISATGEGIYSTWKEGGYNSNTGTSMATPIVSGAAALVKSQYPQLSALQIAERLKSTSDNIDAINIPYANKLGQGRVNVGEAINGAIMDASVVFGNIKVTNGYDDVFKIGDSIFISGTFTNYLAASNIVTATISTTSLDVSVNHSVENLGVMASTLQKDNFDSPFSFKILNSAPQNEKIVFEVVVTDGLFTKTYFVEALINVDYLNITENSISTTIGSKGQFAYNGRDQQNGLGMQFNNGASQLYEAGLMIGTNSAGYKQVVDRVRSGQNTWEDDFVSAENVSQLDPAPQGDYFVQGVFTDANAYVDSIGLKITHTGYASSEDGHENYVVLEYTVENSTSADMSNVSIGLFADFDVADYSQNAAHTDWVRFMTYTESTSSNSPVFGVQLLTQGLFRSYCLDNVSGGNGGVDISSGYSSIDKFTTLTSNRYNAGVSSNGNDVVQVTSSTGFDILAGDSVTVAFAIHAADNVYLLQKSADSAYFHYNGAMPNAVNALDKKLNPIRVYPNPVENMVTIDVSGLDAQNEWSFTIFDSSGKMVQRSGLILNKEKVVFDTQKLNSGVYIIEILSDTEVFVTKLIKNP